MRALALLLAVTLALAAPAASQDVGDTSSPEPEPEPNYTPAPLETLALLRSSSSLAAAGGEGDTTCIAVMASAMVVTDEPGWGYLLAQAHCVAQLQGAVVAEFGVFTVPRPDNLGGEDSGVPAASEIVPIASATYHPEFDAEFSEYLARVQSNASDAFIAHDLVLVGLEYLPAIYIESNLIDNNVADFRVNVRNPNFGVLQVDRDSLEVTWLVGDVAIDEGVACGFEQGSAEALATVCARSPRLRTSIPESTSPSFDGSSRSATVGDSPKRKNPWSVLFQVHPFRGWIFFLGFASSNAGKLADRPLTELSFLWPEPAIRFTDDIDFDHSPGFTWAQYGWLDNYIPGPAFGWLPPHLSFIAGLRFTQEGTNYCGGSLIGRLFVLTAAHCVEGDNAPVWVSVGAVEASGTERGEQIKVARVIVHPDYNRGTGANDLALVEVEYESAQVPVPIFDSAQLPGSGLVIGYGAMTADPVTGEPVASDVLRSAELDIIARRGKCEQLLQRPVDASMFCAGGKPGKDACAGDSGGPLVVVSPLDETFVALTGVVSYGRGNCGSGEAPGVYANVTRAQQFIQEHVRDAAWTSGLVEDLFPAVYSGAMPDPDDSSSTTSPPVPPIVGVAPSASPVNGTTNSSTSPPKTSVPVGGVDNKYEVPVDLSPGVKDALIGFIIGDADQISSSKLTDLFKDGKLVFSSSQSLAGVEAVIAKYNEKPLHQRDVRFPDQQQRRQKAGSSSDQCGV